MVFILVEQGPHLKLLMYIFKWKFYMQLWLSEDLEVAISLAVHFLIHGAQVDHNLLEVDQSILLKVNLFEQFLICGLWKLSGP